MTHYWNEFLFGFYPYLAVIIFLFGSIARFYFSPYRWTTSSSQLLRRNKGMRIGSNFFHIGIILLFLGHFVGLLTPKALYSMTISTAAKQMLSMVAGGIFGIICFIGLTMLLYRRLFDLRIRINSQTSDIVVLILFYIQLIIGLATIPFSAQHLDGSNMVLLAQWAQDIVTFHAGAAALVAGQGLVFKAHLFLGLTIFLIFPFTRLVHVWSVPFGYLLRPGYLIMRKRV